MITSQTLPLRDFRFGISPRAHGCKLSSTNVCPKRGAPVSSQHWGAHTLRVPVRRITFIISRHEVSPLRICGLPYLATILYLVCTRGQTHHLSLQPPSSPGFPPTQRDMCAQSPHVSYNTASDNFLHAGVVGDTIVGINALSSGVSSAWSRRFQSPSTTGLRLPRVHDRSTPERFQCGPSVCV